MNIKTIVTTAMLASFLFSGLCQADSASGLATGKRQHKPVTVSKPIDKATPKLAERAASAGTSQDTRAAYRLCPDGTMINPGEKCPEKSVRASEVSN